MIAPLLILIAALTGMVAGFVLPGAHDLWMLAGPATIASLWLLARAALGGKRAVRQPPKRPPKKPRRWFWQAKPKWVIVDGSNVMHWRDGIPDIQVVRDVVARLAALGYAPGVVFDANAGHKLLGRYRHDHAFAKLLGLPADRVMVVAKGTPADPAILAAARDLRASIVTNDRFRDWAETHPEIARPGHLIKGGYRDGQVWLHLGQKRKRGWRIRAAVARGVAAVIAFLAPPDYLTRNRRYRRTGDELDFELRPTEDQLAVFPPGSARESLDQMHRMRHHAVSPRIGGESECVHLVRSSHGDQPARPVQRVV
jgi:hypothetical protein